MTMMIKWSCGLMDKASDFGSEDCRFESCHDRNYFYWIYLQPLDYIFFPLKSLLGILINSTFVFKIIVTHRNFISLRITSPVSAELCMAFQLLLCEKVVLQCFLHGKTDFHFQGQKFQSIIDLIKLNEMLCNQLLSRLIDTF